MGQRCNAIVLHGQISARRTGSAVIVYADTAGDGGVAEDAVLLVGRTLDDISGLNLGAASTLPTLWRMRAA